MYRLLIASRRHDLLAEFPAATVALVIAELFYKFHSFTLECLAFLATWYLAGAAAHGLLRWWSPAAPEAEPRP